MLQCKDCEFFQISENGGRNFKCDPFSTIKEPECIAKLQLLRLDMLLASYQGMLHWYEKLAPLQNKLFKYMQREIDDMNETENWKLDEPENNEDKF
ncbi:MAG TPA: hypothetical protein VIJ25_06585 [Methylococcales bacterium]